MTVLLGWDVLYSVRTSAELVVVRVDVGTGPLCLVKPLMVWQLTSVDLVEESVLVVVSAAAKALATMSNGICSNIFAKNVDGTRGDYLFLGRPRTCPFLYSLTRVKYFSEFFLLFNFANRFSR